MPAVSGLIFNAAFAFYAVGLFHSIVAFFSKGKLSFRIAIYSEVLAFVLHTAFLVAIGIELDHFPLTNLREVLVFFAWTVTLCFLLSFWRYRSQMMGMFSLPLVTTLMLGTAWIKSTNPAPEMLRSSWVYLHITCLILAYGLFFLTFITSILYLAQQRRLKSKRFNLFYDRLPPLLTMDQTFQRSLIAGFCFMTLGLLAGVIWAEEQWAAGWHTDPKVISAFVTWLIYLGLIYLRLSAGWRGKKAAMGSLLGFLSVLFTFFGARLFFEGWHSFY